MSDQWLRCEVRKGMFSDERVVVIRTESGEEASFFVPRESVTGDLDQEGRVQVQMLKDNSRAWAVVPNESRTIIPVSESEFVAA